MKHKKKYVQSELPSNVQSILNKSNRSGLVFGGMTGDELIEFDPILASAMAEYESKNHPEDVVLVRMMAAASIQVGSDPAKTYALIKTGRMMTEINMKFRSKSDIKEWTNAYEEYGKLVRKQNRTAKAKAVGA